MEFVQDYFVEFILDGQRIRKFVSVSLDKDIYWIRNKLINYYLETHGKTIQVTFIDKDSTESIHIDSDEFKMKYGRSHEECDGCRFENSEPSVCEGHVAGPTACKYFMRYNNV